MRISGRIWRPAIRIPPRRKKEIECLEQAVRLNPKHPRAYSRLAAYYRDKYGQREKKEDYEKALDYSSRQLEQTPEAYYYIERGAAFYRKL